MTGTLLQTALVPLVGLPNFQTPQRLWWALLLPTLVVAYIVILKLRQRSGMRFTNTGVLGAILPRQRSWRRHVAVAMSLCSLLALVLAFAQPLGTDKVPRQRATIVVVIDVSQSMAATDVKPNRLDAEKTAAKSFINQLPAAFNVAIVALSGSPSVRLPPSTDRVAAASAIDNLKLEDGTAVGASIQQALQAVRQAPKGSDGKLAPAAVVLLSDGQNTVGMAPQQAAQEAKKLGIKIHTIAYGTQNGYVDLDGQRYRVAPDKAMLQQIASITGGRSYAAADAKQLNNVYSEVKSQVGYEEVKKPVTAQYAFYALAFAVVAALGAVSMAARWPS